MKIFNSFMVVFALTACSSWEPGARPSDNPDIPPPNTNAREPTRNEVTDVREIKQGKAIVRVITGLAKYSSLSNIWIPLKSGAELQPGATIQTDGDSLVDVDLGKNGPALRLMENTTLVLERLTVAGSGSDPLIETKLDLRAGRIVGRVARLTPFSDYAIKTPTGYARTRGGTYDISAKTDEAGKFETRYGSSDDEPVKMLIREESGAGLEFQQGQGKVRKVTGSAKYSLGTNGWTGLKRGDDLPPGAILQTDPESIVDIYLGSNGPTLRVTSETTLVLEKLAFAGSRTNAVIDTKLDLRRGRILGSVAGLTPYSEYKIKTPAGSARTRGGDYDVSAGKDVSGRDQSFYIIVSGVFRVTGTIKGVKKTWIPHPPTDVLSAELFN